MPIFRITGEYKAKNKKIPFMREVSAAKETDALETIFSEIGSKHRVKRKFIEITEIKQIQPDEITDPIVESITHELNRV